jgi:hypothetical protein
MKLSDYKNEDALDLLADLLEPVSEIMTDKELQTIAAKGDKMALVKYVLKNKKQQVVQILARMENKTVNEYNATLTEMFAQLLDVMNDKVMNDFFASQAQKIVGASSVSATENTAAADET